MFIVFNTLFLLFASNLLMWSTDNVYIYTVRCTLYTEYDSIRSVNYFLFDHPLLFIHFCLGDSFSCFVRNVCWKRFKHIFNQSKHVFAWFLCSIDCSNARIILLSTYICVFTSFRNFLANNSKANKTSDSENSIDLPQASPKILVFTHMLKQINKLNDSILNSCQ